MLCLAKRTLTFMRPLLKFPVLWLENHFRELMVRVSAIGLVVRTVHGKSWCCRLIISYD